MATEIARNIAEAWIEENAHTAFILAVQAHRRNWTTCRCSLHGHAYHEDQLEAIDLVRRKLAGATSNQRYEINRVLQRMLERAKETTYV